VNTARANALVEEALLNGTIIELAGFTALKREVAYGVENSRVDFRLDYAGSAAFVEVKSVTLGFAETPVAAFPDAVTTRGARHLRELAAVRPAEEIDPAYAAALREAQAAGVEVLAYGVDLSVEELRIAGRLPVLL
jgi:sugar fermentation stimulation protein A